jgi:hypothetical protein
MSLALGSLPLVHDGAGPAGVVGRRGVALLIADLGLYQWLRTRILVSGNRERREHSVQLGPGLTETAGAEVLDFDVETVEEPLAGLTRKGSAIRR